jgi:hypothetical protein
MSRLVSLHVALHPLRSALLLVLYITGSLAAAQPTTNPKQAGKNMKPEDFVLNWIDVDEVLKDSDYRPIKDFAKLPDPPAGDSLYWAKDFFARDASPYAAANKAKHSYYLAGKLSFDLLRHEYSFKSVDLVVIEGRNFTLICAKPPKIDLVVTQGWRPIIEAIAQDVLNMKDDEHTWTFQYPPVVKDKVIISTAPTENPYTMGSWTRRADCMIRHDVVHFLCYKKRPSKVGFLHDGQWFPDDFRQASP